MLPPGLSRAQARIKECMDKLKTVVNCTMAVYFVLDMLNEYNIELFYDLINHREFQVSLNWVSNMNVL